MKIEHAAYQVEDAAGMAAWYCRHLGFVEKRGRKAPFPVYFLADESGRVMIEIYTNPAVDTPDYRSMDPLLLHLAFVCADVPDMVDKLKLAGAELVNGIDELENGDVLAMLRDPWGFAVQLCCRREPMI